MQRVTVSLDDELAEELDRFMQGRGYHNRSEAIRDLARSGMQQARGGASDGGDCVAALVYVYDHNVRALAKRLADAHHHHHDLAVASLQIRLDHASCMEVSLLRGGVREVHRFAEEIISERGVRHGRLVAVPVDVREEVHAHGEDHARGHAHIHVRHA